jgi:hypothetical protein
LNRGQLRELVLYWLDDLEAGYFTPTQVNLWLNNAQREVQKLLIFAGENYYLTCAQTTLNINQNDYALPDNFLKMHRTELVTGGVFPNEDKYTLDPITVNQQDFEFDQTGQPDTFYLSRQKIYLFPIPDLPSILRIYYSYRVSDMQADSAVPDVPEEFHEFLAVLAAIDGAIKDERNLAPLLEKRTYYENMLKQMADDRVQNRSRQIVMNESYGATDIW